MDDRADGGSNMTRYLVGGALGALLVFALIVFGLYQLGGPEQSALERLRDIAVIFVILLFLLTVVLLAGIVAALAFLVFQIKDRVIPLLEELTGTVRRVRGTAEFMTEEAVKPILSIAGAYARMRATTRVVLGKDRKRR